MPTTKPLLSSAEKELLWRHLLKHKAYPYTFDIRQTTSAANFPTQDGAIGDYRTYTFTPPYALGIVGIATGFIITANSVTGLFAVVNSYRSTMSMAEGPSQTVPNEGQQVYKNISNGGAINDFQVFFPLNIYVEANKPFYTHVWVDRTNITTGTAVLTGHITLWTLPTDIGG